MVAPDSQHVITVHHEVKGPTGETILDPVFAELLFVARWRRLPLQLIPSRYPTVAALGALPASSGGALSSSASPSNAVDQDGAVTRPRLLNAVAALSGYQKGQSDDDEAFSELLRHYVADAIEAILYCDDGVWEDFTKPALARSAPRGMGWYVAWSERRRHLQRPAGKTSLAMSAPGAPGSLGTAATGALSGPQSGDGANASFEGRSARCSVALLELTTALTALAERLDSGDSFADNGFVGGATGNSVDGLCALDACAFGHLSVLYSIPCQAGSRLFELLSRFPTLAQFCDRMELRLGGTWPSAESFLAGFPSSARAPGASCTSDSSTARSGFGAAKSRQVGSNISWWEAWGWSSGERHRPPESKAKRGKTPEWYGVAFGIGASLAAASVAALGWGPPPVRVAGLTILQVSSAFARSMTGGALRDSVASADAS